MGRKESRLRKFNGKNYVLAHFSESPNVLDYWIKVFKNSGYSIRTERKPKLYTIWVRKKRK